MVSDAVDSISYAEQIRAFFHYGLGHLFEFEFGFRAATWVLISLLLFFLVLKICWEILKLLFRSLRCIFKKFNGGIGFVNRELFAPFRVDIYEKLAYKTNNPNWQERADKIKDVFTAREKEETKKASVKI